MFNLSSFESLQGTESGLLGTAINHIRYWLTKLVHSPETGVVKLTTEPNAPIIHFGELVTLDTGASQCTLADSRKRDAIAVSLSREPLITMTKFPNVKTAYFRMTGVAEVKCIPGLDLNNGDTLYLDMDATPGQATNVQPLGQYRVIGTVIDDSKYTLSSGYLAETMLEFDNGTSGPP